MIVSPKVLISKKPEENVQSEDKQCKTLSARTILVIL